MVRVCEYYDGAAGLTQREEHQGMIGLGGDSQVAPAARSRLLLMHACQAHAHTSAAAKQTTAPGADVGDYLVT